MLMLGGQVALALAPSIGIAITGRILVGAGDAMTFISVIRLLASWFSGGSFRSCPSGPGTVVRSARCFLPSAVLGAA